MVKKLAIIALCAASFAACKNDKKPTTAETSATAEAVPPSIVDTTAMAAERSATAAVSDKEAESAKQKTDAEAMAAKKAAEKKATDAANKKKTAEVPKKADKPKAKPAPSPVKPVVVAPKADAKGGKVAKNPGAMIPAPAADNNVKKRSGKDDVFVRADVAPLYPGGEAAMMKYLQKNIKYPAIAKENGVKGTVFVQFVVEKDGTVDDVVIVKGVDKSLNAEAKRVVSSMPKWAAGSQGGIPVAVQYVLPVKFELIE
jgi:TonB family protein